MACKPNPAAAVPLYPVFRVAVAEEPLISPRLPQGPTDPEARYLDLLSTKSGCQTIPSPPKSHTPQKHVTKPCDFSLGSFINFEGDKGCTQGGLCLR